MAELLLELAGISKRFPGVIANDDITFQLRRNALAPLEARVLLPAPRPRASGFCTAVGQGDTADLPLRQVTSQFLLPASEAQEAIGDRSCSIHGY